MPNAGGGFANLNIVRQTRSVPFGFRKAVETCLKCIPIGDLAGLERVELWGSLADIPDVALVGKKICELEPSWVKALYRRRSESSPAFIILFVDSIYFPLELLNRLPPILTIYLCHFVAHEIGHHLIEERGYVFTPDEKYRSNEFKEEMANRYAFEITTRMKANWHYRFADRILKYFSKVYFEEGRQSWKRGKFQAAASSWYKAWLLDQENEKAGELYWHARKKDN